VNLIVNSLYSFPFLCFSFGLKRKKESEREEERREERRRERREERREEGKEKI